MTETPKPCRDEHNWAEAKLLTVQPGKAHLTAYHRICFDCGAHELQKDDGTWIPLGARPRPNFIPPVMG